MNIDTSKEYTIDIIMIPEQKDLYKHKSLLYRGHSKQNKSNITLVSTNQTYSDIELNIDEVDIIGRVCGTLNIIGY